MDTANQNSSLNTTHVTEKKLLCLSLEEEVKEMLIHRLLTTSTIMRRKNSRIQVIHDNGSEKINWHDKHYSVRSSKSHSRKSSCRLKLFYCKIQEAHSDFAKVIIIWQAFNFIFHVLFQFHQRDSRKRRIQIVDYG